MSSKKDKRKIRHSRVRAKINGKASCPRFSVFKSNKYMYAQLIDDEKGVTLVSASSEHSDKSLLEQAKEVGKTIAEKAKEKKISKVVFDRSGYLYAGRIKALADSAREAGLTF